MEMSDIFNQLKLGVNEADQYINRIKVKGQLKL